MPTIASSPNPSQSWLDPLPGILVRGSVNLMVGVPNVGKTALMASWMAAFRDGEPIFGRLPNPVEGLGVISLDRSWSRGGNHWYHKVGFPEIVHYSPLDDSAFKLEQLADKRQQQAIFAFCLDRLALPKRSLVLVDPITPFLGSSLNDYHACMGACLKLARTCGEQEVTVIGNTHALKQKGDPKETYRRLEDRTLGSTALQGFTDTLMYLANIAELDVDDATKKAFPNRFAFMWHPRQARAETFQLEQGEDGLFTECGLWTTPTEDLDTIEVIYQHIPEDWIRTPDLMEHVSHCLTLPRRTFFRALKTLVTEGRIERGDRGSYRRRPPS